MLWWDPSVLVRRRLPPLHRLTMMIPFDNFDLGLHGYYFGGGFVLGLCSVMKELTPVDFLPQSTKVRELVIVGLD